LKIFGVKKLLQFAFLRLILVISALVPNNVSSVNSLPLISVEINLKIFQLEVASSSKDRQRGLMYRRSLDNDQGMLFIYPNPGDHRIWMKNTLIPLTVIWVDRFSVVTAVKYLKPCYVVNCPVSSSPEPSSFIIELNSDAHDISVGDEIPDLLKKGN
jgi:uncharacterized membrane protein (UPF0127 family)